MAKKKTARSHRTTVKKINEGLIAVAEASGKRLKKIEEWQQSLFDETEIIARTLVQLQALEPLVDTRLNEAFSKLDMFAGMLDEAEKKTEKDFEAAYERLVAVEDAVGGLCERVCIMAEHLPLPETVATKVKEAANLM